MGVDDHLAQWVVVINCQVHVVYGNILQERQNGRYSSWVNPVFWLFHANDAL